MKNRSNIYVVVLLLIIVFADRLTWCLDNKLQQVWGANWMGSAGWAHPVLFIATSVCVTVPILGVWRIVFKRWIAR